jgi:hypothetical protein
VRGSCLVTPFALTPTMKVDVRRERELDK